MIVPVLGALTCSSLIYTRIHSAVTSADTSMHIAPLIAGGIIVISVVLYVVLKPKNPVVLED